MADAASIIDQEKSDELELLLYIVVKVLTHEWKNERTGAAFCVRHKETGELVFLKSEGKLTTYDKNCFEFLAAEKTFRLMRNPGHILSRQSSVPENGQHSGGVRYLNGLLGALSGFSANEDEVASLWIGVQLDWLTEREADAIAKEAINPRYKKLYVAFDEALESAYQSIGDISSS